jgi:hypothetical protein
VRRHQWRAVIVYRLDDETAAKMYAGPPSPPITVYGKPPVDPLRATLMAEMIDQENSVVGCWVCEMSWQHGRHRPCPGHPVGYSLDGTPIHPGDAS